MCVQVVRRLPPEASAVKAIGQALYYFDSGALAALLKELNKGGSDDITYRDDIKPWLGGEVGVAVISVKSKASAEKVFEWVAVKDEAKAEKTITKGDTVTSTGKVAGTKIKKDVAKDDDTTYYAFKDKVLLISDKRANLATALKTTTQTVKN